MPAGQPTKYNEKLASEICELIAAGKSLRTIGKQLDFPLSCFFDWVRKYPEFSKQYAIAKMEQAEALTEEMLDIADDGSNDWMLSNDPENPGYKFNNEHYQRARLRLDTRKWLASKLKPKKYGDKVELSGDPNAPINIISNIPMHHLPDSEILKLSAKKDDE